MPKRPAPPVPAEADLRGYQFLPLDVLRLRDSRLAATATGEEFRAAVLLWCASWHQVPAGSLPNDERELAALAGFGRSIDAWREVAEAALHGWVEHSDGRLYHQVITEKALEAYAKSKAQSKRAKGRWKKGSGNATAMPRQSHGNATAEPTQCQDTHRGMVPGNAIDMDIDNNMDRDRGEGGVVPDDRGTARDGDARAPHREPPLDQIDIVEYQRQMIERGAEPPPDRVRRANVADLRLMYPAIWINETDSTREDWQALLDLVGIDIVSEALGALLTDDRRSVGVRMCHDWINRHYEPANEPEGHLGDDDG